MILPVHILKLHSKEFYSRQFINMFLQTFTGEFYLIFSEKQEIHNTQRSPDIISLDVFSCNKRNPVLQQFCFSPQYYFHSHFFYSFMYDNFGRYSKKKAELLGFFPPFKRRTLHNTVNSAQNFPKKKSEKN